MQFIIYEPLEKAGHKYKSRKINPHPPPKYTYEYDEPSEPRRRGPHERAEREKDKDWKPPTERYSDRDVVDKLIELGDWLFVLQASSRTHTGGYEKDDTGFSSYDMDGWRSLAPVLDGQPDNARPLRGILAKYKRQIAAREGLDEFYKLGLQDAIDEAEASKKKALVVSQEWKATTGDLMLPTGGGKIARSRFQKYIETQREFKQYGLSFDGATKSWYIRSDKVASFPWDKYTAAMEAIGFSFGERPDPPDFKQKAQEAKAEMKAQGAESVIQAIKNRQVRDTIAVTVVKEGRHKGKIGFWSTFSPEFNTVFSNKSGVLSGITEYNKELGHARLTNDIRLAREALEKLKERMPDFDIVVDPSIREKEIADEASRAKNSAVIPEVASKLAPGIELFPFQNEGVRFLQETDGNALIGDEMGLGKTLQTLSYVAAENRKALVICPKVVRKNWLKEAEHFFPGTFVGKELVSPNLSAIKADLAGAKRRYVAYIRAKGDDGDESSLHLADHYDDHPEDIPEKMAIAHELGLLTGNLATINYENVEKFLPYIEAAGFDTIVIDESHRIKNPKAKRTKLINRLAKGSSVKHRILLSGTAVKNKKVDLFEQIEMVEPGLFSSPQALKMSTHGEAWHKLSKVYRARTKREVIRDMPDKTSAILKMDVKNLPPPPGDFGEISRAKSELAQAKVPSTVAFVNEMLESSDSNILVFTDSVPAAEAIAKEIGPRAVVHHGQTSDKKREDAISKFDPKSRKDNETVRVFVATTGSAGIGINLQTADKVVFNDLPWTPADLRQAEDRAYRIGTKNNVNVYWMVAEGHEFDESIADILKRKYELSKKLQEGKQLTEEERAWMDKPINPTDVLAQMKGETAKPKDHKKYVITETKTGGQAKQRADERPDPIPQKKEEPEPLVEEPDYGPKPKRRAAPKPVAKAEPKVEPKVETKATKPEEHAGAGSQPRQMTLGGESQAAGKPVQLALFKSMTDHFVLFRDDFDMDMERVDGMLKSFDFDGALDLIKAAGHKYLRRIPTGKQSPRWRYVYAETSKHHRKTFQVGEKVQITHGDQKGHYEVTAVHPNGYVTIKHDETGHYLSMKAEHLHEEFQKEHASKIQAAYRRLKQTVEAANVHGTENQKSRARIQLAEFERRWGLGRFSEKGPAPKLVAKPEPKPKAEPEARVPVAAAMDPSKVVPNEEIPAKIDEMAKLGMKTLKDMRATLEDQRIKAESEGKGTPVSMLRWGRILDGAMALVGTAEKVKEQKAKPAPKKRGRKKMAREDRTRFGSKDEAWAAILSASGDMEGLENTLSAEKAYDLWKRGKGPKPPPYEHGETDAINQALDLAKPLRHQRHKMKDNRVSSIRDGFDRLTAGAKTWADLEHAIEVLRQVPGLESIQLPERVQQRLDAERMAVEEKDYFEEQQAYYDAQKKESEDNWDSLKDDEDYEPGVAEAMSESDLDTSFDFGANVWPDTDDEAPGTHESVGEELVGSRKEKAAAERKKESVFVPKSGGDADFEYLSDPELAKLAHKDKLMEPFNPEDFLAQGYDPGYVAVRGAIEKLVSQKPPVANRLIQEHYIKGVAFLQKGMDRCQTVQDLKEFMEEWNRLCYGSRRAGAFESTSELYQARDAKLRAQGKKLIMTHDEYKKLEAKKEELFSRMLKQTVQEDNSEAGRKLKAEHNAVKKEMEQYEYGNVEGELASYYGDGMRNAIRLTMDIPQGSEIDFERHGSRLVVYQRDPDLDRGLKFDSKRVGKKGEEALATYNEYFKMAGSIGQAGTRGVQYGLNTFGKTSKAIRDAVRLAERWDAQRKGQTVYPEGKKMPEESMEEKRQKIGKLLETKKQKSSDRFRWRHTMTGKPERIGGKPISKADAKSLMQEFNLRGVQLGEWVNNHEAEHHILAAHGAFSDMADVLGLDPKQLSFGGRLGFAIGSRGRGHGAAHYEPENEIIALTKFAGGGSLAHEWGHALDNILAKWARPEGAPTKVQTGPLEYRAVKITHGDAPDIDQDVLRAYNRIQSMMFHGDPDAYEKEGGATTTSKFYDASRGMSKAPSSYHTSPHEMFARAFESYVHDKLQSDGGRANTYLVSGTTREEIAAAEVATRLTGSAREIMVPYPEGDERKQLMLLFDDFMEALRSKDMLKKALMAVWRRLSGSSEIFVIPLERI